MESTPPADEDRLWKFQRTKRLLFRKTDWPAKKTLAGTSSPLSWWSIVLLLSTPYISLTYAATNIIIPGLLEEIEPARVSCDAAYSLPCARTNAQWLTVKTANEIHRRLAAATAGTTTTTGSNATMISKNATDPTSIVLNEAFESINNQSRNVDVGFYPFVFDKYTGKNMAHGGVPLFVGFDLQAIFDQIGIGFSQVDALEERFVKASESPKGGGWVGYLWSDKVVQDDNKTTQVIPHSKMAYVVSLADRYYLGVGYEKKQLPPDLPCTADYDSWCSITNVRSLTGRGQGLLNEAESLVQFENGLFKLSFDKEEYQIPGGFYTFVYGYDGILRSHALIHEELGKSFSQIMVERNLSSVEEADKLHRDFIAAAEGENGGWIQYKWRPRVGEPEFLKIAFIVKIEFDDEEYYLGAGFNFANRITGVDVDRNSETAVEHFCSDQHNLPCAFDTSLQLSSHALTHAISSPKSVNEIWDEVSNDPTFHSGGFYVYAFDYNSTCVAHGAVQDYVGMTVEAVLDHNDISLDADTLHNQFRTAAEAGGGWVLYDWRNPGVGNSQFTKIAYLFKISLEGKNYYGGIGFNHQRGPVEYFADTGTKMNGNPVECSYLYEMDCSDMNARAILGQALGDLILASSEARVSRFSPMGLLQPKVEDVSRAITNRNAAFLVNDFFVSFFSVDPSDECEVDDGSGCCLAHGSDPELVGKTWQQILDSEGITSIPGRALHDLLTRQSNTYGGVVDYPYSKETGVTRTKLARVSNYKHEGKNYYVVAEYFKTPQPPTCDSCPIDMECTRPTQSYCKKKPNNVELPSVVPWVIAIAGLMLISLAAFYWNKRRNWKKRKKLSMKIKKMEEQFKNMVQIVEEIPLPCMSAAEYKARFGQEGLEAKSSHYFSIDWGWEEDKALVGMHSPADLMTGTNFVKYSSFLSNEIEQAYVLWKSGEGAPLFRLDLTYRIEKMQNQEGGYCYVIDFQSMRQTNRSSGHSRAVRREELYVEIDSKVMERLPPLPAGVNFFCQDGEDFLPTVEGQVIQVSKEHPNKQWLYGSILHDPLVVDTHKDPQGESANLRHLSKSLHDRPSSGWFPAVLSKPADPEVMQKIVDSVGGGVGNLNRPDSWEPRKEGRIAVEDNSIEYEKVSRFFLDTLQHHRQHVAITKVERIQSFPLWQSYAVKKETMKKRDMQHPENLMHNKDPDGLERRWLFHGTTTAAIPKIIKQGFNRAFAGRNAVAFGKGVYFAR